MSDELTEVPPIADEVTMLRAWLDFHRDVLRRKCAGLDQQQLAAVLPPSDLTLGGLVKHLALVEDWWFGCMLTGEPAAGPFRDVDWEADADWEWHSAADDTPEQLFELHAEMVRRSDERLEQALADGGLDHLSVRKSHRQDSHFTLRWIVTHMVEEYARHNGHADLIRQSIDGATGD